VALPPAQVLQVSPEEQKRIDLAIDRGLAYLRRLQLPTGVWHDGRDTMVPLKIGRNVQMVSVPSDHLNWQVGYSALPGLTLLVCGVPRTDPGVQQAARFVRLAAPTLKRTYEISLAILFLDRLGEPEERKLIQSLALRLVAGQNISGGWRYTCPILNEDQEQKLLEMMRQRREAMQSQPATGRKPLLAENGKEEPDSTGAADKAAQPASSKKMSAPKAEGKGNRPSGKFKWQPGDNSNTQFAILGLWAARRYELPLEPTVCRIEERFRYSQLSGGGWSYDPSALPGPAASPSGSMTCAGLLGLAVGRALRAQVQPGGGSPNSGESEDRAIFRGLRALGARLNDPRDGRVGITINHYYLWSVERVGVLYGLRTIGGKDWYRWGASYLLAAQKLDGSWCARIKINSNSATEGATPTLDTCFALLFLKRADLLPGLGEELRKRVVINDPVPAPKGGSQKKGKGTTTDKPGTKLALPPEASPLAVSLGEVKAGMPTERRFIVRYATSFRITAIQGTDHYLMAKTDTASKTAHELTVTFQPSAPGEVSRTLRLVTDLPGRREVEVTVKARAVP
jgi:hypothetical protein